ncbi:MAG: oligosaccharide repeat unit polymerase [Bermanella sp.]|jgi:oligosaccharide repeat unit polymerase
MNEITLGFWILTFFLAYISNRNPVSLNWFFLVILFPYFCLAQIYKSGDEVFSIQLFVFFINCSVLAGFYIFNSRISRLTEAFTAIGGSKLSSIAFNSFSFLAVISLFLLIEMLGGISDIQSNQSAIVLKIPELGFLGKLLWEFGFLYFFATAILIATQKSLGKIILHFLFGLTLFYIFGRRGVIINGLIVILITYIIVNKVKISFLKAALSFAAIFILLMIMLVFRLTSYDAGFTFNFEYLLSSPEFYIGNAFSKVFDDYGLYKDYRYGLDFLPYSLRNLFEIDLLASYPSIGAYISEEYFNGFNAGVPPSIYGTLYINFGWFSPLPAILLAMFFSYIYSFALTTKINFNYFLPGLIFNWLYNFARLGDFWLSFSATMRLGILIILIFSIINYVAKGKNE